MKPPIETLRGFGSFTKVITQGRKYEKRPIKAFVYISKADRPAMRVGFAVARAFGKATLRNRGKRLLREAFRKNQDRLLGRISDTNATEIVFLLGNIGANSGKKMQFEAINEAFEEICSSINVVFTE